jgi:hypothetical protein
VYSYFSEEVISVLLEYDPTLTLDGIDVTGKRGLVRREEERKKAEGRMTDEKLNLKF